MYKLTFRIILPLAALLTTLTIGVRAVTGMIHPISHNPAFLTHPDCSGPCWQGLHLGSAQDDVLAVMEDPSLPLSEVNIMRRGNLAADVSAIYTPAPGYDQHVEIQVRDRAVFVLELSQTHICLRDLLRAHGRPRAVILSPDGEISTVLYNTGIMRATVLHGKHHNTVGVYTISINYRRQNTRPQRFHWHQMPAANLWQPCP